MLILAYLNLVLASFALFLWAADERRRMRRGENLLHEMVHILQVDRVDPVQGFRFRARGV